MKSSTWTITYQTEDKKRDNLRFTNLGLIADECHIIFKKSECILLIKTDSCEDVSILKECILSQAEEIADLLSWKYDIALRNGEIVRGNPRKIKIDSEIVPIKLYGGLLKVVRSRRSQELLRSYREIINEKNSAMRFLMCYRLIEVISKENKIKPDILILSMYPNINLIAEKRDKSKKNTILTHIRNKIHATKNGYCFPYSVFNKFIYEMQKTLKHILEKEIIKVTIK